MASWKNNKNLGIIAGVIAAVCVGFIIFQVMKTNQPPKEKYKRVPTGRTGPGGESIDKLVPIDQ